MNLKKMVTPDKPSEWPNGIGCCDCSKIIAPGEAVLAGRTNLQGTIVFHKGCIFRLTRSNWPEARYHEVRQRIIDNPERLLFNQPQ